MSKLAKDIMAYGSIDLLARMIGLITSPITTRLLTLPQYGAGPLLSAVWGPFALMQYGGMDSAYPYFKSRDNDPEKQKVFLTTATYLSNFFTFLFWSIFAVVGFYGVWLSEYASVSRLELTLFILGILPAGLLYWFLYILRFMKNTALFVHITFFSRILPALISIPLIMSVAQPDRLIMAWSVGCFIQYTVLIYALYKMKVASLWPYIKANVSVDVAKQMLRYGLILAPVAMVYSLTTVTDRLLVGWFLGVGDVAILQLALSIGGVGLMLSGWFGLAFDPHLIEWIGSKKIQDYIPNLQKIVLMLSATFLCLVCGAVIWSEWVFYMIYPSDYRASADLIPYLLLAGTFPVLSRVAIATILIADRPKIQMVVYVLAFTINLAVGVWLIPQYGVIGAVIGTVVSEGFIWLCWVALGRIFLKNFKIAWGGTVLMAGLTIAFAKFYSAPPVESVEFLFQSLFLTVIFVGAYIAFTYRVLGCVDPRKMMRLI